MLCRWRESNTTLLQSCCGSAILTLSWVICITFQGLHLLSDSPGASDAPGPLGTLSTLASCVLEWGRLTSGKEQQAGSMEGAW